MAILKRVSNGKGDGAGRSRYSLEKAVAVRTDIPSPLSLLLSGELSPELRRELASEFNRHLLLHQGDYRTQHFVVSFAHHLTPEEIEKVLDRLEKVFNDPFRLHLFAVHQEEHGTAVHIIESASPEGKLRHLSRKEFFELKRAVIRELRPFMNAREKETAENFEKGTPTADWKHQIELKRGEKSWKAYIRETLEQAIALLEQTKVNEAKELLRERGIKIVEVKAGGLSPNGRRTKRDNFYAVLKQGGGLCLRLNKKMKATFERYRTEFERARSELKRVAREVRELEKRSRALRERAGRIEREEESVIIPGFGVREIERPREPDRKTSGEPELRGPEGRDFEGVEGRGKDLKRGPEISGKELDQTTGNQRERERRGDSGISLDEIHLPELSNFDEQIKPERTNIRGVDGEFEEELRGPFRRDTEEISEDLPDDRSSPYPEPNPLCYYAGKVKTGSTMLKGGGRKDIYQAVLSRDREELERIGALSIEPLYSEEDFIRYWKKHRCKGAVRVLGEAPEWIEEALKKAVWIERIQPIWATEEIEEEVRPVGIVFGEEKPQKSFLESLLEERAQEDEDEDEDYDYGPGL